MNRIPFTTKKDKLGVSSSVARCIKKILPSLLISLIFLPTFASLVVPLNAQAADRAWYDVAGIAADGYAAATNATTAALKEALNSFVGNLFEFAATQVINSVSKLLWLSGLLLEYVVKVTVTNMATVMNGSPTVPGIGESINQAWTLFRDVSNLAFIFIILYLAFQLILGVGSGHWRSLGSLIVMAILINFSLFFTKVVIDASNVLAVVFYAPIESAGSGGVSQLFMKQVNLSSIWNATKPEDTAALFGAVGAQGSKTVILMLGGSLFIIITSFVFFAVSILLMIRFLYLMLLMVLSPLAFACFVLPGLKGYFNKWWSTLIHQAFFAPAMFLLILMSFKILGGMNKAIELVVPPSGGVVGVGSFFQVLALNTSASIGIVFNFAISIFFMIYSLLLAQKLGASGAATTLKWGRNLNGRANSMLRNTGGYIGRKTIGSYAQALGKNDSLIAAAQAGGLRGAAATHLALRPLENIANSKFGGNKSSKEISDREDKERRSRSEMIRGKEFKENFAEAIRPGATPAPGKTVQDLLTRSSGKDLESFKLDQLTHPEVLTHMTKSQFEHLTEKSDKFTDADKDRLRVARLDLLRSSSAPFTTPPTPAQVATQKKQVQRLIANMRPDDFKKLKHVSTTDTDFSPALIAGLTWNQLKELDDLPEEIRFHIGQEVLNQHTTPGIDHRAFEHINKPENKKTWGL